MQGQAHAWCLCIFMRMCVYVCVTVLCLQAMTKSQVEGGFYSQIPSGLAEYYNPGVKRSLVLFSAEGPLMEPEDRG